MPTSKKMLKMRKMYAPQILSKDNQKINKDRRHQKFDENYGKASGVPYWVNTRQDYEDNFMQKIKNWQFNPSCR